MLIHFLREQVSEGLIQLHKVSTASNIADILTKIISGAAFTQKANQLLGIDDSEEYYDLNPTHSV